MLREQTRIIYSMLLYSQIDHRGLVHFLSCECRLHIYAVRVIRESPTVILLAVHSLCITVTVRPWTLRNLEDSYDECKLSPTGEQILVKSKYAMLSTETPISIISFGCVENHYITDDDDVEDHTLYIHTYIYILKSSKMDFFT